MIISHKHKFIFFAVPKTATHTIRQALAPHLGSDDWEQQNLFEIKRLPIPELAEIKHGHISVQQLKTHLSRDTWESYYKFGFVRNPFDRYVSTCFFLLRDDPNFEREAIQFMKQALNDPRFHRKILVRPQSQLLTDGKLNLGLDFVGRFETLQQSYDEICKHIGISSTDLSEKNISRHEAYNMYYDSELSELVATFYKDDLKLFDYDDESLPLMK